MKKPICNEVPPKLTQEKPNVALPPEGNAQKPVNLEPLERLLADRYKQLAQLKLTAGAKELLLNAVIFEIKTIERLCDDLGKVIEEMKS